MIVCIPSLHEGKKEEGKIKYRKITEIPGEFHWAELGRP